MENCRLLNANEIECRIGQQKAKSVTYLLYKNARVDMALLDERFGSENWQRDHKEIKGNLYCGVGVRIIRENGSGEWAWKWDCGTESKTEREKGEASDSFKRACVLWGQGRELYSAPKISIWIQEKDITTTKDGKTYWNTKMEVSKISYNKNREIDDLVIVDQDLEVRYDMHGKDTVMDAIIYIKGSDDLEELKRRANIFRAKFGKDNGFVNTVNDMYAKFNTKTE